MKKLFPIYPVLLGLFWVLGIYSTNQTLLPGLGITLLPIAITTGVILAVLVITWLIVRDWRKSALITTMLFLVGVSYGHIRVDSSAAPSVLILMGIFGACGVLLILRGTKPIGRRRLTVIANVVSICLLLVASTNIGISAIKTRGPYYAPKQITVEQSHLPDIYYIVPDRCSNFALLEKYFGWDSSEFLNYLKEKGFHVVEDAHSNYPNTINSLPSSLNMKYLTKDEANRDEGMYLYTMLEDHRVGEVLKERGYKYIQVGPWWNPTATNRNADVNLKYTAPDEFSLTLYKTTILYPIGNWLFPYDLLDEYFRRGTLHQFEDLKEVSKDLDTTFTFAHFLVPHNPFIFNSDGSSVSLEQTASRTEDEEYLEQVRFTLHKLEEVIDTILENSEIPPIIILQGDEGPEPGWVGWKSSGPPKDPEPEIVRIKTGILYAVYLPGATQGDLKGLTSPVNTFRVVFNHLFETDFDILPDRYYFDGTKEPPYKLVEVTDIIAPEERRLDE